MTAQWHFKHKSKSIQHHCRTGIIGLFTHLWHS